MKCEKCTAQIDDGSVFCPLCGAKQSNTAKLMFCPKCGNEIFANTLICPSCGSETRVNEVRKNAIKKVPELVKKLSGALIAESILWIVISFVQLLCGLILLLGFLIGTTFSLDLGMSSGMLVFAMISYFLIGTLNLVFGIIDITKVTKIKKGDYTNIISTFQFKKAIGFYIWNGIVCLDLIATFNCVSFIFLCLIIPALLIDIIGERLYVRKNYNGFRELERFSER